MLEVTNDQAAAEQELQKQQIDMVVIVPADVQSQFQAGQQSVIKVEFNQLDPTRDNYARFVIEQAVNQLNQAIIAQVVGAGQQYVLQTTGNQQATTIPPEVAAAPTRADTQNIAPLQPTVVAFFAPAVLALVLQHMGVTLTALSMVRERLSGAMDLFRVAPVRTREILIGKYLAYAFFNLAIAAIVVFLLVFGLKVPILSTPGDVASVVVLLTLRVARAGAVHLDYRRHRAARGAAGDAGAAGVRLLQRLRAAAGPVRALAAVHRVPAAGDARDPAAAGLHAARLHQRALADVRARRNWHRALRPDHDNAEAQPRTGMILSK